MSNDGIIRYGTSIALLSLVTSVLFGRLLVFSVLDAVVLDCGVLKVVDTEVVAIRAGSSVVAGTSAIDVTGMLRTIVPEVVNSFSFTPYTAVDCSTTPLSTSGAPLLPSNSSSWTVVLEMRVASSTSLKIMGITVLADKLVPEVVNSFSFTPYSVVDCNTSPLSTFGASVLLSNISNWMVVLGIRVVSFTLLKMMGITVLTGNSVLFAMSLPGADVFLVAVVMAKDVLCSGRKSGVVCL